MQTILITGCSSGFGFETARFFLDKGWKVVATMRTPREGLLPQSPNLRVLPLDVTDERSIRACFNEAGPIDVLVNNAGVGLLNALEGVTLEQIRDTFGTNTIGTMAVIQAALPQMRERRAGTIINVTSSVTLRPLHLLSVYTASKAAVNAFSEVLALELEQFNIRVRVVLPGRSPSTKFGDNARARMNPVPEAYTPLFQQVMAGWQANTDPVTTAPDVAEAIWRVVNEPAAPFKTPAGADAEKEMAAASARHR